MNGRVALVTGGGRGIGREVASLLSAAGARVMIVARTATELAAAGKRKWEKFLHVHKLWRPETVEKRLELFAKAADWKRNEAVTRAKRRLAVSLAKMLLTLERQLDDYRAAIEALFAKHPDHDLFGSLPGAGPKIAPRLLGEIGSDRSRFEDPSALQCLAGTAPVSSFNYPQVFAPKINPN